VGSHQPNSPSTLEMTGGWWYEPMFPIADQRPELLLPPGRLWAGWPAPAGQRGWRWQLRSDDLPLDGVGLTVRGPVVTEPYLIGICMKFGQFLADLRQSRGLIPGRADLWTAGPEPADGQLALPHLTTVIEPSGRTVDQVIWEELSIARYRQWLGEGFSTDLGWVQQNLAGILSLRALARTGQLDGSADAERLRQIIGDRFLSVRAVCHNIELIQRMLAR
jgi:hypothetical protein